MLFQVRSLHNNTPCTTLLGQECIHVCSYCLGHNINLSIVTGKAREDRVML